MIKQIAIILAFTILNIALISGEALASPIHTVKTGDTLWSISQNNNVSVEDLQALNKLDSTIIYPSQQLVIKSKDESYVVVKGDTLSKIADNFNIPLKDLMRQNKISNNLIHPGNELSIETKTETTKSVSTASEPSPTTVKSPPDKKSPPNTTAKEMTMTATAYTAYCTGCSGTTYTGIDLRSNPNQKVIAVDPNVIPLGSRVWVEGYGEAIAGDIGSAIKGNIIDVFIEHQQDALNWGRKTVNIKILE